MLGIRAYSKRLEERAREWAHLGLIASVGVDVLVDGLILGIGFAVGGGAGFLLTIALAVELLSLGLATVAAMAEESGGRTRATILIVVGLAGLLAVASVCGATAFRGLPREWFAMVLSFA